MPSAQPAANKPKRLFRLREPIWITERGDKIPVSQIKHDHLKRIERWLKGMGKTGCPLEMHAFWYGTIRAEMDKRSLKPLPPHPEQTTIYIGEMQCSWNQRTHTWEPDDTIHEEDV